MPFPTSSSASVIQSMFRKTGRQLKISHLLGILGLLLAAVGQAKPVKAQIQDNDWAQLIQLSSPDGQVEEQTIFADDFGYVHLFWIESGFADRRTVIMYSRFDGALWSSPIDIFASAPNAGIGAFAATSDRQGNLHLAFSEGFYTLVQYTTAPIQGALSASNWRRPVMINAYGYKFDLVTDSGDHLHLLYSSLIDEEPGIYYISSEDGGETWSPSIWLDPDIPVNVTPSLVNLERGDDDALHALWFYQDENLFGTWVRYANSFDHGRTWSRPFTIDEVDPPGSNNLRMPYPALAVSGKTVHAVWAGDYSTRREHRVSRDAGLTWSEPSFVFGNLLGQALGDGLAVDAAGRMHFMGQIRWPQGVYHFYWDDGIWSPPEMVYLIARDAFEPLGDRVHAHRVRLAIRSGNQLVLTFTTSTVDPQSILYATHYTMTDVNPLPAVPLPTPTTTPAAPAGGQAAPAGTPEPTAVVPTAPAAEQGEIPTAGGEVTEQAIHPMNLLLLSTLPTVFTVVLVLAYREVKKRIVA